MQIPQRLEPVLDRNTPEGVQMWLLEKGVSLPADCPVSAARFVVAAGAATALDSHDVVEAWTVMKGSGVVHSGQSRTPVRTGDCVFFASQVPHLLVNDSTEPVEVFSIWWSRSAS